MQSTIKWGLLCLVMTVVMISCKKDDTDEGYNVPSTYTFTDNEGNNTVSFSGQTARLDQLSEIVTYMKTANTQGVTLDAQQLKDMYANTGDNGNGHFSFTADKQLKNKTFSLDQDLFEDYMDSIAVASTSSVAGGPGVAGVVESNSGAKKYLFAANGIEYGQIIEKGLMGAVFYYQATSVYLADDKMNVDNTTAVDAANGKYYTTMEHHWDEAFGYLTDATNFPTAGTDRFWGKYANSRDGVLDCNSALMTAFTTGRAAISNDDLDRRASQIDAIRTEWEKVIAATAISYFKGAKSNFADDALRNHELSEAIAFVMCLKYNSQKSITNVQIDNIIDTIGNDLYTVTTADIDAATDELVSIFGMENIVSQL